MESIPPTVKHLVKFVNLGVLALTSRKKIIVITKLEFR